MAEVTVSQFAEVLKVPVDRLLVQLDQAGIKVSGPEDQISDDAKLELLTHLRRSHGSEEEGSAPRKITLRRKTQSALKLASVQGRSRTVNVEVRQKRTYIKRDVLEEQARQQNDEVDAEAARGRGRRSARRTSVSRPSAASTSASRRRTAGARKTNRIARRPLQDDVRRQTEQRAREEAEQREREQRRVAEPPRAERARVEPPVKAPADDKHGTRYGRQELHVVGDVSSRYKKKRRVKSRTPQLGRATPSTASRCRPRPWCAKWPSARRSRSRSSRRRWPSRATKSSRC